MVGDIIETIKAGLDARQLNEVSASDWTYAVIGLLTKYEVNLRTLPIEKKELYAKESYSACEHCNGFGGVQSPCAGCGKGSG